MPTSACGHLHKRCCPESMIPHRTTRTLFLGNGSLSRLIRGGEPGILVDRSRVTDAKDMRVFLLLLTCTQLACSTSDNEAGIQHARMQGPSLGEAVSLMKAGMTECEVVALLKAAHLPSGQAVRTHREGSDCLVAETNTSWIVFHFKSGKLIDIGVRG
jgi:hypothetical protein